jgi:hypothetical protein
MLSWYHNNKMMLSWYQWGKLELRQVPLSEISSTAQMESSSMIVSREYPKMRLFIQGSNAELWYQWNIQTRKFI